MSVNNMRAPYNAPFSHATTALQRAVFDCNFCCRRAISGSRAAPCPTPGLLISAICRIQTCFYWDLRGMSIPAGCPRQHRRGGRSRQPGCGGHPCAGRGGWRRRWQRAAAKRAYRLADGTLTSVRPGSGPGHRCPAATGGPPGPG